MKEIQISKYRMRVMEQDWDFEKERGIKRNEKNQNKGRQGT